MQRLISTQYRNMTVKTSPEEIFIPVTRAFPPPSGVASDWSDMFPELEEGIQDLVEAHCRLPPLATPDPWDRSTFGCSCHPSGNIFVEEYTQQQVNDYEAWMSRTRTFISDMARIYSQEIEVEESRAVRYPGWPRPLSLPVCSVLCTPPRAPWTPTTPPPSSARSLLCPTMGPQTSLVSDLLPLHLLLLRLHRCPPHWQCHQDP